MGKSRWLHSQQLHGGCRKFAYLQKDPTLVVWKAKSSHLQEKVMARCVKVSAPSEDVLGVTPF